MSRSKIEWPLDYVSYVTGEATWIKVVYSSGSPGLTSLMNYHFPLLLGLCLCYFSYVLLEYLSYANGSRTKLLY